MQKESLYHDLMEALTDRDFLRGLNRKKGEMFKLIQSANIRAGSAFLTLKGDYTASDVLRLCEDALQRICAEPENGWLNAIYDYLLLELFPCESEEFSREFERGCAFYLKVLRVALRFAKKHKGFDPMTYFELATQDEMQKSGISMQYERFVELLEETSLLELMHIGRTIKPFDMLGHVAGVHHIAMHTGRQLDARGVSVDLPLVSASACMHDVGKYGCKGSQARRIPYLHYYYTEEFLKRHGLFAVAHIAANHSTWDLELENLPVESLLLIYADFRVKSVYEDGREKILFYSLKDSYDVILNKLDDVDDIKRKRYERVYAKLKDFEDYMVSLGVNPDPYSDKGLSVDDVNEALLCDEGAVRALKLQAVSHNIMLMSRISSDASFADILEDARSEKDWKNIRTYVNIIEEYFTYMTQKQKRLTLRFLYELFMHAQGDIRSQAAALYGKILAGFDIVYRKELPPGKLRPADTGFGIWEESLELMLSPDFKLAEKLRVWISYSLKEVLPNLINNCSKSKTDGYLEPFLRCFERDYDDFITSVLLDSLIQIPRSSVTAKGLSAAFCAAKRIAGATEPKYRAFALRFLLWALDGDNDCAQEAWDVINALNEQRNAAVSYLLLCVYRLLPNGKTAECEAELNRISLSELYLENLKTATPWVIKEANIRFLLHRTENEADTNAFQVATHFVNLIRVSEQYAVRHRAGQALERIAPKLTLEQRNEIAVELTRGMESSNDEFAKYLPRYLGRFVLSLHPKELDEVLDEFYICIKSKTERTACIALTTLGVILTLYDDAYRERFNEGECSFAERRKRMLGLLLGGFAHYNETVSREAFLIIGKQVFGGGLCDELKGIMFELAHKKLLTLIVEQKEHKLTFLNNAASLNHIYRFIVDTEIRLGAMRFGKPKKAAFFPGTFDPFSSSHKAIVNEVLKQGFEVYLALDEFSWSKRTQPHMIRRRIVNMSVADMFDVYIFPDNIPVNLANPDDLKRLRCLFPKKEVYVAVGSDVIKNASAYRKPPVENSIHSMGHIVFRRSTQGADEDCGYSYVTGDIKELTLDNYFEEVSSTLIRENIDHNREISMLVDPAAQGYIYDNGLYLREPQYKELLRPENMYFKAFGPDDAYMRAELINAAAKHAPGRAADIASFIYEKLGKPKASILALFNGKDTSPLGTACYYSTSAQLLYNEFKNVQLAEYTRRHTSGKIAVIAGLYAHEGETMYDVMRLLITEVLAKCLMEDYTYAIHIGGDYENTLLDELLERRGFVKLPAQYGACVYAVDMRVPIALIEDVQERIKSPLSHDEQVVKALRGAQHDFASAVTKLYPGRLVLSFHAGLLNHALVRKVLKANGVEHIPPDAKQLGECMCVPYGKTLRGIAVPNTVTKTLHVDKAYKPDMKSFDILKYPGYSTLSNQISTIKSFNRPVILVDDLLHKGYRLETLDPLFKEVGLNVREIIVGILSGRGKDLMSAQDRQVESVYFIPNLRYWFVDSMLYPFLGGDSVQRPREDSTYLLPSVNQIFPYTSPAFISGAPRDALFGLSLTCLNNARSILLTLEKRHQELFGNNLTLNRLGQAMQTARVPDKGGCMRYDGNLAPSLYVENDIEMLLRLENLICNGGEKI